MNTSEEEEDHQHQNPPQTIQSHPILSRLKPFAYWVSAVLVILLALSLSFPNNQYYKLQYLKSTLSFIPLNPNVLYRLLRFIESTQQTKQPLSTKPNFNEPPHCVLWMAPFLSGGGYSSEAWSYITALNQHKRAHRFRLAIEQHGDLVSFQFWEGLPKGIKDLALVLHNTACRMNETIVVCHSEPGAWYPPLFDTLPCPPIGYEEPMYVIGRTMFETDRVNPGHAERCNAMDSVWVPTDFHVSTFIQSGVEPTKVVKVVQPVDVKFFDPSKYEPLGISSRGKLVIGSKNLNVGKEFVFLSIFKWEYRKGWDVLLSSYLKEFSKSDKVALYLLTNPYHSDGNFGSKIVKFVEDSLIEEPLDGWAPVFVISTHIAQVDLPRLYRAADAFVLPSRGEGWGRPVVEAMAMALPVIVTNWSGPTEYLTEENGYLLPVDRMREVMEGPFKGHYCADPSIDTLRVVMRHVMSNPDEAMRKGVKAREDMIRRFSPEVVADLVADHILKIFDKFT